MAIMQNEEETEIAEDWLTTYADAITLLMAFFIMLVSFSKIDIPIYEKVAAGIKNEIGKGKEKSPTQVLKDNIQDAVYAMQADQAVAVEMDENGIRINLASGAFYKPGSADIREEAFPVLQRIGEMLHAPIYRTYDIDVEGHTDNEPISTRRYPSNWELSAGRAAAVVRYFTGQAINIDSERMKATGFADTIQLMPNVDREGVAIKENQAANRRVVLRVFPMSLEKRARMLRKIAFEDVAKERGKELREGAAPSLEEIGSQVNSPENSTDQPAKH